MMRTIDSHTKKLYQFSCLSILTSSFLLSLYKDLLEYSILPTGMEDISLPSLLMVAFVTMPIALWLGSWLLNYLKIRTLFILIFLIELLGVIEGICSSGQVSIFISLICFSAGSGIAQAVCNPLVTTLYPNKERMIKIVHLYAFLVGGIAIGKLTYIGSENLHFARSTQIGIGLLFLAFYAYWLFSVTRFDSIKQESSLPLKKTITPFFLLLLILACASSILEMEGSKWVHVLLNQFSVASKLAVSLLCTIVVLLSRSWARKVLQYAPYPLILCAASLVTVLSLWLLHIQIPFFFYLSVILFSISISYSTPLLVGIVAEKFPRGGHLAMGTITTVGSWAFLLYTPLTTPMHNAEILKNLPQGVNLVDFQHAEIGSIHAVSYMEAQLNAMPNILMIPIGIAFLASLFWGILHYKYKKNPPPSQR